MGRECRRVPPDWKHPKTENGHYAPLLDGADYAGRLKQWEAEKAEWDIGNFPDYALEESRTMSYEEWAGPRPKPENYMPVWSNEEATHFMMYENTSEGTPISPAFAVPEECAQWCVDNGSSAVGSKTADFDFWMRVIDGTAGIGLAWAPGKGFSLV